MTIYTQEEIEKWRKYEKVRKGGRFNMFDPRARKLSGLTEAEYSFVMQNYGSLKDASNPDSEATA